MPANSQFDDSNLVGFIPVSLPQMDVAWENIWSFNNINFVDLSWTISEHKAHKEYGMYSLCSHHSRSSE
jgi:hypothetical protein